MMIHGTGPMAWQRSDCAHGFDLHVIDTIYGSGPIALMLLNLHDRSDCRACNI